MVNANADASAALRQSTAEYHNAMVQLQQEFKAIQEQLLQDLEAMTGTAQSFLGKLVDKLAMAVQTTMSQLNTGTKEVEESIDQVNAKSTELQKKVGAVFDQAVQGGAELAAIQAEQWDQSRDLSTGLQSSLREIQVGIIDPLLSAINSIRIEMVSSRSDITVLELPLIVLEAKHK